MKYKLNLRYFLMSTFTALLLMPAFLGTLPSEIHASNVKRVDPSVFERLAQRPEYNNVCLIKCYKEDQCIGHGTGTLCEIEGGGQFILSAAHVVSGARQTAVFNDGIERELINFSPLFDAGDSEVSKRMSHFNAGLDLALGFLNKYPSNVLPAHLASYETSEDDEYDTIRRILSSNSIPYEKSIQYINNNCINKPCHLAGFGRLIFPGSSGTFLFHTDNKSFKKTALTLSIEHSKDAVAELFREKKGIRLESTFKGYGEPGATEYEQPLRSGFSGSGLRNESGEIIAVASHSDSSYLYSEEFNTSYPKTYWILNKSHNFIQKFNKPWQYRLATFGMGSALSYGIGGYLGIGTFTFTLVSSYLSGYIPQIDKVLCDSLAPKGTKSYFSFVPLWKEKIESLVDAYHSQQTIDREVSGSSSIA